MDEGILILPLSNSISQHLNASALECLGDIRIHIAKIHPS